MQAKQAVGSLKEFSLTKIVFFILLRSNAYAYSVEEPPTSIPSFVASIQCSQTLSTDFCEIDREILYVKKANVTLVIYPNQTEYFSTIPLAIPDRARIHGLFFGTNVDYLKLRKLDQGPTSQSTDDHSSYFTREILVLGPKSDFAIYGIDDLGNLTVVPLELELKNPKEVEIRFEMNGIDRTIATMNDAPNPLASKISTKRENLGIRFSVASTYMNINQTDVEPYSQLTTTAKASYQKFLGNHVLSEINGFGNLLPIAKSRKTSVNFLGANVRLGIQFPALSSNSRIGLSLGYYYSTMLVENNEFGYQHLIYPQFYPSFSAQLTNSWKLGTYLKFVPMTKHFSIFSTKENDLAAGLSLEIKSAHDNVFFGTFDYSRTRFNLSDDTTFYYQSISLGLGIYI